MRSGPVWAAPPTRARAGTHRQNAAWAALPDSVKAGKVDKEAHDGAERAHVPARNPAENPRHEVDDLDTERDARARWVAVSARALSPHTRARARRVTNLEDEHDEEGEKEAAVGGRAVLPPHKVAPGERLHRCAQKPQQEPQAQVSRKNVLREDVIGGGARPASRRLSLDESG